MEANINGGTAVIRLAAGAIMLVWILLVSFRLPAASIVAEQTQTARSRFSGPTPVAARQGRRAVHGPPSAPPVATLISSNFPEAGCATIAGVGNNGVGVIPDFPPTNKPISQSETWQSVTPRSRQPLSSIQQSK